MRSFSFQMLLVHVLYMSCRHATSTLVTLLMLTDLRFVRYGTGVGMDNIELVFVYSEEGTDIVHWIFPQPEKEIGKTDMATWCASTVEVSNDTLKKASYEYAYKRDVGRLREAVDSKKPDILNATVRALHCTAHHVCHRSAT